MKLSGSPKTPLETLTSIAGSSMKERKKVKELKGRWTMKSQRPKLNILEETTLEEIVGEALVILEQVGIVIEDEETIDILRQMGAEVGEGNRVKFRQKIVRDAIESAPKELTLFDLDGKPAFEFGDGQVHFNPGSAALFLLDASTSEMRLPKIEDVVRFSKICQALENIEATSTGLIPSDVPKEVSDSLRLYISCLFSTKPVVTGTFSEAGFDVMRDLLLARTGQESLRSKPCAIFDVCPSSPLRWSKLGCHDLRQCAQNAIPAQLIAMPLPGALAPMSLLATVVQHTVETLSGITIHQAWTPGSPIIYGGSPALFDMRHSTSPMGAIETLLIDVAYAEVGKHLGLPTQAYLGMSDAKALDAQAGIESAMTLVMAAAAKIDFVSGPGMLNFESCQSLEKLVLDNEICGMARRFKAGLEPRGKTFGIDAIKQGLDEGNFLTTEQTLKLYKEEAYYPSAIIDRRALKTEGKVNDRRLIEEAAKLVEKRLSEYVRPEISPSALKEMKSVMEKALKPFGIEEVASKCLDF